MNGQAWGLLAEGGFWAFIIWIAYLVIHRPHPAVTAGVLRSGRGVEYAYTVGNNIYAYTGFGNFNGIDVRLQVEMPHIYLDSRVSGGRRVNAVFDSSQLLQLEGNFNKTFNVFVPQKYEYAALSILSPDVMEILQRYAENFDIEIYGDHLRVISNKEVLKDASLQAGLLEVANVLLKEIEDRARSWSFTNSAESIDQDLLVYHQKGIRLFGRYITWTRFWLSFFWVGCTVPFLTLVGYFMYLHQARPAFVMLGVSAVVIIGLQLLTSRFLAADRFHSRADTSDDGLATADSHDTFVLLGLLRYAYDVLKNNRR